MNARGSLDASVEAPHLTSMERWLILGLTAYARTGLAIILIIGLSLTWWPGNPTLSRLICDFPALAAALNSLLATFGMGRTALVVYFMWRQWRRWAIVITLIGTIEIVLFLITTFITLDADYTAHIWVISTAVAFGTLREAILLAHRVVTRPERDERRFWYLFGNGLTLALLLALTISFAVFELDGGPQDSGLIEYAMLFTLIEMNDFHVLDLFSPLDDAASGEDEVGGKGKGRGYAESESNHSSDERSLIRGRSRQWNKD